MIELEMTYLDCHPCDPSRRVGKYVLGDGEIARMSQDADIRLGIAALEGRECSEFIRDGVGGSHHSLRFTFRRADHV